MINVLKYTFEEFIETFQPKLNPYYNNLFSGYGFKTIDFNLLMEHFQSKLIWSIMKQEIPVDVLENRFKTVYFMLPGKQPLAIAYMITTIPFTNPNMIIELP